MENKLKTGFAILLITSFLIAIIPATMSQATRYGAQLDHIRYKVIKSPDAQTLAMTRDELDILTDLIRPVDIETLNRDGKKILSTPGDHFCYLAFNMRATMSGSKISPFGPQTGGQPGLALRHAIAHLIPKTVLIGTLFKYIVTLIHTPMAECIGDYGAAVDQHPFNIDMAEDILNDAGWSYHDGGWYQPAAVDPIAQIDFISPTMTAAPTSWTIAETTVENMRTIGLDVIHTELDLTTIIARIDANDFDMFFLCWTNMGRFADHLYDFFISTNDFPKGYNRPGIRNATLDVVLTELYTTLNKTEMEEKVVDALYMLMGDPDNQGTTFTDGLLPYIPIYSRTYYAAHDEDLLGVVNAKFDGSWNGYTASNMYWRAGSERASDLPMYANPGYVDYVGHSGEMAIFTWGEDPQLPANPLWTSSAPTWDMLNYVHGGLIGVNPYTLKDVYYPGLLDETLDPDWPTTPGFYIELWTVTDGPATGSDGMKVTFYLDTTDVYYHDGHEFDVYDIAFQWEYMTANKIPRGWGTFEYLHHVTVWNSTTITAYMTQTGITIPYGLSSWSSLVPEHIWGCVEARGGRALPACDNADREDAWNAELSWINTGDVNGTAGTKPSGDPDSGDESGLCTCGGDPILIQSKTTCSHGCGCVLDDRSTGPNEILSYDPEDFARPTDAYPFLTELIGTGPFVWHGVDQANGIGDLIVFDESSHKVNMPNIHYFESTDKMEQDLKDMFWQLGDVNLNGEVTIVPDIATMGAFFMQAVPPAPSAADVTPYPITPGFVDMRDISTAGKNYGEEREVLP